jgi:ERCC4-related helicase
MERMQNYCKSLNTFMRLVADGMGPLKNSDTYRKKLEGVTDWSTPKLDHLLFMLPDILRMGKAIIHTDFESNLPIIVPAIEKELKVKVLTVYGGMKTGCSRPSDFPCGECPQWKNCTARRRQVWFFTNDDNYKLMAMTSAGEKGLNLQVAQFQINYDLPWNPSSLIQREGRINRISSKFETNYVINLISLGSIEEVILEKILAKKKEQTKRLLQNSEEEAEYIKQLTLQLQGGT